MFDISLIRILRIADKEFEIVFNPDLDNFKAAVTQELKAAQLAAEEQAMKTLTQTPAVAITPNTVNLNGTPAPKRRQGVGRNGTGYSKFYQLGCTREQLEAAVRRDGYDKLTPTERQITLLAIAGEPSSRIAAALNLNQNHVMFLRREAARKLGFTPLKGSTVPKPAV